MKAVSESRGVSRSQLTIRSKHSSPPPQTPRRRRQTDDGPLLKRIEHIIGDLPSYGYRRVWGLLRRQSESQGEPLVNAKRVCRVMRDQGLLLAKRLRQAMGWQRAS